MSGFEFGQGEKSVWYSVIIFYMPGNFTPHVRMMKIGFDDVELVKKFGMPYGVVRNTHPYDTATLNYNWQIWSVP